jgi:hypothetical protein
MRFDPSLAEAVVQGEMSRREQAGDTELSRQYRRLADPLYEIQVDEAREEGFARLHLQLFEQSEFPKLVSDALAEFPQVVSKVQRVFVARAYHRNDEGADLSHDRKNVGIMLLPERFLDAHKLRVFVRHELMHVADMLDEGFDYRPDDSILKYLPAQRNVIRDRYRVLWDATIDGRLTRARKETVASRGVRFREFSELFANLPEIQRLQLFERFWGAESVTHQELLQLAQGFKAEGLGVGVQEVGHGVRGGEGTSLALTSQPSENPKPLPGSPCPLCRFPTHQWAEDLEEDVAAAIKQDFPQWQEEQSLCERCAELYRLRAGKW